MVNLHLDRQRMEETYFALLSDDTGSLDAFDQEDLKVLDHSVQRFSITQKFLMRRLKNLHRLLKHFWRVWTSLQERRKQRRFAKN